MKARYFLVLFFLPLPFISSAQYVTLDGRQFKDGNGNPLFPLACCYSFDAVYNTGSNQVFLAPYHSYGPGYWNGQSAYYNDFETNNPNQSMSQIIADFTKLKNSGFNCIRNTQGAWMEKIPGHYHDPGFVRYIEENKHPFSGSGRMQLSVNPPYETDSIAQIVHFPLIDSIISAARQAGLYLILDIPYIPQFETDLADYAAYLEVVGNRYKDDTTILAYSIMEEPEWFDYSINSSGGKVYQNRSKNNVCEMVSSMYDALKSADSNHLITMGSADLYEIDEFDPGVMKLDFICPHFYPQVMKYENYGFEQLLKRIIGKIKWLEYNCPMPWMIGEMSFSAVSDTTPVGEGWDGTDGDLQQQKTFADTMLKVVRNCHGSGFSWWQFQDIFWGHNRSLGWSLFRHGNISNSNSEKPVVQAFRSFSQNMPPIGSTLEPENYFDPYNLENNPEYNFTGSLTEDITENPIEGEIAYVWTSYTPFNYYTFDWDTTNVKRFFCAPFNNGLILKTKKPCPTYDLCKDYQTKGITLSTTGSSNVNYWHEDGYWNSHDISSSIERIPINYDLPIDSITILPNAASTFIGWNSINVSDLQVYLSDTVTFKARKEVSIGVNFFASNGSEVHIYNTESFGGKCNNYVSGCFFKKTSLSQNCCSTDTSDSESCTLELSFLKGTAQNVEVFPNPSAGLVNIILSGDLLDNQPTVIKVLDHLGRVVYGTTIRDRSTIIDLGGQKSGAYVLHFVFESETVAKKLIIQNNKK